MRSNVSLRSVALTYALGLIWCAVMLGTAILLSAPMATAYVALEVEALGVATVATTTLAILLATVVTGSLWFAFKRIATVRGESPGQA